jgi:hypothetical protein
MAVPQALSDATHRTATNVFMFSLPDDDGLLGISRLDFPRLRAMIAQPAGKTPQG